MAKRLTPQKIKAQNQIRQAVDSVEAETNRQIEALENDKSDIQQHLKTIDGQIAYLRDRLEIFRRVEKVFVPKAVDRKWPAPIRPQAK